MSLQDSHIRPHRKLVSDKWEVSRGHYHRSEDEVDWVELNRQYAFTGGEKLISPFVITITRR